MLRWSMLLFVMGCPAPEPVGTDGSDPQNTDGTDDTDETDETDDTDVPWSLTEATDPGRPGVPGFVDRLTVEVRTGSGTFDGTNDGGLSLCLTATDCVSLNVVDVDDNEPGQVDVHHRRGFGMRRADLDRVELRTADGTDLWRPVCVQVSLDGEPIHCRAGINPQMGSEGDETPVWADPQAPTLSCEGCFDRQGLTHGPMVGATDQTRTRIWVRTDSTRAVSLRMDLDDDLSDGTNVAWAYPKAEDDFTAVLPVEGLLPDTVFHYGIEVDGRLVHQSKLRTAPDEPGRRRIAMGSCTKADEQPIFAKIDDLDPDVFLFLGDNHYGNTPVQAAHRFQYRWSRSRPERAALLDHTVTLATWDDHDYVGNNTDGNDPGAAQALAGFREYWANPTYGADAAPGAYMHHRWGDVEIWMVDARTWRGVDGMLGAAQSDWLLASLRDSDAVFKLVGSGSQWTEYGSNDSWKSFQNERNALFNSLADSEVEGLVLLSGDIHRSEFLWVKRGTEELRGYDLPEITSSSIATWQSPCKADRPTLECFDATESFVMLDVDTAVDDPTLTATIYGLQGNVVADWEIKASQLR
ncbi:MAG: alkaline phosphatase [Myxococcota bacterium]